MTTSYKNSFEAIGTHWHIEFVFDHTKINAGFLMSSIQTRIDSFDKVYSRFRSDSLVAEIAKARGTYILPQDAEPMLRLYQRLYTLTHGAFTPLIGSALVEAGYDANYSLIPKQIHTIPQLESALTYEPPYLIVHQPIMLDVGAAGKGYLVDIVGTMLKEKGVTSYIIDAGGDIALYSERNISSYIGLEHPTDSSQAIGIATLSNQSICGSAGQRRTWGNYHHIINPHTLQSPKGILATWVVANTTMLADALATCIYLVPASDLIPHFSFEYLIIYADYSIERSSNFPAELFTSPAETKNI